MYQSFPYPPSELSAFALTMDIFVISLTNGAIVQHSPEDTEGFYRWLQRQNVREVAKPVAEYC